MKLYQGKIHNCLLDLEQAYWEDEIEYRKKQLRDALIVSNILNLKKQGGEDEESCQGYKLKSVS
jgi:hypothetical protein